MSAVYPGISEPLPMPPPWRPEELVAPVRRSWGSAPERGQRFAIVFWLAFIAAGVWCWPAVKLWALLWLVGPLVFPWCGCCW